MSLCLRGPTVRAFAFVAVVCVAAGFVAVAALGPHQASASERRVALVIGNAAYQHAPHLANPRNDASDVAASLEGFGFTVIKGFDLDKAAMDRMIREFAAALHQGDTGLFFYAGHGLQVAGINYLVPVDAELTAPSALDFEMVRLDVVQRSMERETATNILFLDACRDNPLVRNLARTMGTRSAEIGHGLSVVESGIGTLISFSTQPGNVAFDGAGRNSPFTAALLRHIAEPGQDLSRLLISVRNDVIASTRNQQVPWEDSALRAPFYFVEPREFAPMVTGVNSTTLAPSVSVKPPTLPPNKAMGQLWQPSPAVDRPSVPPTPPAVATPVSRKVASTTAATAVAIEAKEVVRARLAANVSHFWQIKAPPGQYRLVFDIKRADDQNSNLAAAVSALDPDGRDLGPLVGLNAIDVRRRLVKIIDTTGRASPDLILRVGGVGSIVDYWLGIFPLDAAVAFPYFSRTPTVEPLDLGRPVSAVLEAPSTNSDGAWYSVDVDAQDYRVSAEFTRVDGVKSNLAAGIDMFGRLGETGPGGENICGVNAIDVSARCARKLVFSEKASLLFRVRARTDAPLKAVVRIEPLASD